MNPPTDVVRIQSLPFDIYEHILLVCHPYQVKNLYYTCKFLYISNKALLAKIANKWCWPHVSPFQILKDIPHLTFPNIWKASLFYHPLHALYDDYGKCIDSRSIGKFDGISLYYQACLNGYTELQCEGFITSLINMPISTNLNTSISELMAITLIASKYEHNHILNKLVRSLSRIDRGLSVYNDVIIETGDIAFAWSFVINSFITIKDVQISYTDRNIGEGIFIDLVMECFESIMQISIDYPLEWLFRVAVSLCKHNCFFGIDIEILNIITTGNMSSGSEYESLLEVIYASFHLLDRTMFLDEIYSYLPPSGLLFIADKDPYLHNDMIATYPFFSYLSKCSNPFDYITHGFGTIDISKSELRERIIQFTSIEFYANNHDYYTYLCLKDKLSRSQYYEYNRFGIRNSVKLWLP